MFKTSKLKGIFGSTPSTPKISSVSLPEASDMAYKGILKNRNSNASAQAPDMLSTLRSMTPSVNALGLHINQTESDKKRKASKGKGVAREPTNVGGNSGQSSRSRSQRASARGQQTEVTAPVPSVPSHSFNVGGGSSATVPLFSWPSSNSSYGVQQTAPTESHTPYCETVPWYHRYPPQPGPHHHHASHSHASHQHAHHPDAPRSNASHPVPLPHPTVHRSASRQQGGHSETVSSSSGHRGRSESMPSRPRGILKPPKITEVPLKDESIALAWPLTFKENALKRRGPPLYFDVGFDPIVDCNILVKEPSHKRYMSKAERELPACTHSPITKMVIKCKLLSRWPSWIVTAERNEGLRCIDVFQAIFDSLHTRMTREEYYGTHPGIIQDCMEAFRLRCQDSQALPQYEERQGFRRVDLLRGKRIFNGLTWDSKESSWILELVR